MTVPEEASDLWLFDSHKNSKRSPWLQSTLSELEGKTKAMLKLIEGDADTFAQRAEMYYKKRPELVSTIEDFYRAYRSLAERHDQLRLESGYAFSNRGWLFKDWNSTDKSSESSSVVSECMVSEVDDPESEDDQVESKFTDVPKKIGSVTAIRANEDMSSEFQGMLKNGIATNLMTAETKGASSDVSNITTHTACKHSELAVGKPNESNSKDLLEMAKKSDSLGSSIKDGRIKSIAEESLMSFTKADSEKSKGRDSEASNVIETVSKNSELVICKPNKNNLKGFLERAEKSDPLSKLIEDGTIKSISEEPSESFTKSNSEESKGSDNDASNVIETVSKNSELVICKPNENNLKDFLERAEKSDPLSKLIEDGTIKSISEEPSESLTKSNSEESKGSDNEASNLTETVSKHSELLVDKPNESNSKDFLERGKKSDPLSLFIEYERFKSEAEESLEPFTKSNSKESQAYDPKLDKVEDAARLTSQVERLQEENGTFRTELERKDNEKREVIRQLSLSMDILREENVCMRKFIKESQGSSGLFKFKDLKGVFRGKIFGGRSRYQTTLVAL